MNQSAKSESTSPAEPVTQSYPKLPTNSANAGDNALSQQQLMAIDAILMGLSHRPRSPPTTQALHARPSITGGIATTKPSSRSFASVRNCSQASIDRIHARPFPAPPRFSAQEDVDSTYAPRQIRAAARHPRTGKHAQTHPDQSRRRLISLSASSLIGV